MRFRSWRSETWKRFFRRSSPHLISRCLLVPNCLRADLPNDVQQIRMTEIGHGLSTGGHFVQKCQVTSSKSKKKDNFSIQKVPRVSIDPKTAVFGTLLPDKRSPLPLSKLVWTKHSTHTTAMQCAKRSSRWSRLDHMWTFFVPFFANPSRSSHEVDFGLSL